MNKNTLAFLHYAVISIYIGLGFLNIAVIAMFQFDPVSYVMTMGAAFIPCVFGLLVFGVVLHAISIALVHRIDTGHCSECKPKVQ